VPKSIVAESVGALMARRPAEAARRGYVRDGDRISQKPGPENQLGQMKLDFANALGIGIHDTPARGLFARDKRALSHGCIRVDDPLGFAATLLGGDVTREALAAMLPGGQTQRLAFAAPIPVIIGYFTAEVDDTGVVLIHNDIYRLDRQEPAAASQDAESECAV
jgi:murein L,D-transpeptidase YcbB/YkuD